MTKSTKNATTSTTASPLAATLRRADRPDPTLEAADVEKWPAGSRERLEQLGLLAALAPAPVFSCDACGFDHVEPVQWVRDPSRPPRAYIACPEVGAVHLDPAQLARWSVRLPALASRTSASLGATGEFREVVAGRVWKLGTVRASSRSWVTFLAVGLGRADGAEVAAKVPELHTHNAVVLVPAAIPQPSVWGTDKPAAVVPLCDLLSLAPSGLVADKSLLDSFVPAAQKVATKGPSRVFPTPVGTEWEQVHLTVRDLRLTVRVGGAVEEFTFAEAGFENRRKKGVPDNVWALLNLFAKFRGELGTGDAIKTKRGEMKAKVSVLRDRLRQLLALDDDPFQPNHHGQPYRTRFKIECVAPAAFATPAAATWEDLSLTETATGLISVGVAVEGRTAEYVQSEDQGGGKPGGRWEGATDSDTREHTLAPADLGLSTEDPKTSAAGEAFLAVLRSGGRLKRAATDAAMLKLGKTLTDFFRIKGSPFGYDPKGKAWVAQFEAHSDATGSGR